MRDNSGSRSDLGLTLSSATFWLSDSNWLPFSDFLHFQTAPFMKFVTENSF